MQLRLQTTVAIPLDEHWSLLYPSTEFYPYESDKPSTYHGKSRGKQSFYTLPEKQHFTKPKSSTYNLLTPKVSAEGNTPPQLDIYVL